MTVHRNARIPRIIKTLVNLALAEEKLCLPARGYLQGGRSRLGGKKGLKMGQIGAL